MRKQAETAVFTKFLKEIAREAAIAETARQIRKRKGEKVGFTKLLRAIAQEDSTQTIDQAWNEYQLARALREAHYERERFRSLSSKLENLVRELATVDKDEPPSPNELFVHTEPDAASAERRAAISALDSVFHFLVRTRHFHSRVIYSLRIHLKNIENGSKTPEMFEPSLTAGRKSDGSHLQSLKGYFAGMAFVQMASGMSREQATSWVARKIPSDLTSQISSRPVRSSTVKEWMNQYGTTSKIRRELKSIITPDTTVEGLVDFIGIRYRSGQIEGSFGQLGCLRMIYFGHKFLIAGDSVPFSELFAIFREERQSPAQDQDAEPRQEVKHEVRRLFDWRATTQLARLYFVGELTETQVQAGELVGRIFGEFDRAIGAPEVERASPHYGRACRPAQDEVEKS
jgi:hypothetical protein